MDAAARVFQAIAQSVPVAEVGLAGAFVQCARRTFSTNGKYERFRSCS